MKLIPVPAILKKESWEEQSAAGRSNPRTNIVVTFRRRKYRLLSGHGSRDDVYVYRNDRTFYVLVTNSRLEYAQLAEYVIDSADSDNVKQSRRGKVNYVDILGEETSLMDSSEELQESIGHASVDILQPYTMVRRLAEYLPY